MVLLASFENRRKGLASKCFFSTLLIFSATDAYSQSLVAGGTGPAQVFNLSGLASESFDDLPQLLREDWDTNTEVRWDIAKPLSAVAYQVYEEEPIITRYFLSSLGFDLLTEVPFNSMYAYIALRDDVMLISFRGTNMTSFHDWDVNLQDGLREFHGHNFHTGFVNNYLGLRPTILEQVKTKKPKHVWITGHSLGGALAVVAAVDLSIVTPFKPMVVTFGQPRVADSAGAKWIDSLFRSHYARFLNGSDIVPSLPPSIPFVRTYAHAGDLYAFGDAKITIDKSKMTIPPSQTEFCGSCGRTTTTTAEPIYQTSSEQPPLSQEEFKRLLGDERKMTANTKNGRVMQNSKVGAYFFDWFADHKMGKYVRAAHSYASDEKSLAIPGRSKD